jgi:hypothetical protein
MPNASWKEWEREMGRYTGRIRSGPVGDNVSDLVGPFLDIECKYRTKLGLHQADFNQAQKNARGKMWAVALKEKGTGRRLVVMAASEWAILLKLAEYAYSLRPELLSELVSEGE